MDSTPRRTGFFSNFRFSSWRSDQPPQSEESQSSSLRGTDASRTPPAPRRNEAARDVESPAKRASAAQLSTRRILSQPKGPSSKLSSVVNSTDLRTTPPTGSSRTTNFAASTPKAISFSGVSNFNSRPGAYSSATTPRNMFRQSAAPSRPAFSFSPRVPYNTMKESFPPATPGRSLRASTAELNGRTLSKAASTGLFQMRVPSPPPELSGEALAKQVPDQATHPGSVYADEFLAHLVPPGLDDLQRRQWLCILDLRRLKYAADEIFSKKDWKLNILSFAKEYEKSRSLIMLRYGLYEFKTKPSAELEKQWQQTNGIPTSDEEARPNGAPAPGGRQLKRRAEEDLPRDEDAGSAKTNKRRAPERQPLADISPSMSTKRKASGVETAEDSQRARAKKGPTASKNALDRIFSPQNKSIGEEKPAKDTVTARANPFATQSKQANGIFTSSPSKSASSTTNIFAHLNKPTISADVDDDSEESEASEEETEENSDNQEASQSDEASVVASGAAPTPIFGTNLGAQKTANSAGLGASSASSSTGDVKKTPSLFDRISYGADGNPLRMLGPEDRLSQFGSENGRSTSPERTATPVAKDQTWKPESAIKFSSGLGSLGKQQPTSNLFGSAPPSAASQRSSGSAETEGEASGVETPKPVPSQTSSIFAPKPQVPAANPFAGFAPKLPEPSKSPFPTAPAPARGFTPTLGSEKPSENVSALNKSFSQPANSTVGTGFKPNVPAAAEKPASASDKPENTATSAAPSFIFGAPKTEEKKAAEPAISAPSLFAPKTDSAISETAKPNNVFQSSTLFGNAGKATSQEAPKPSPAPSTGLFGSKPAEGLFGEKKDQPPTLFGSATKTPTSNIFGSLAPNVDATAANPMDISPAKPASTLFGVQPAGTTLFGNTAGAKRTAGDEEKDDGSGPRKKPMFGGFADSAPQTDVKPAAAQEETRPVFSTFNFGGTKPATGGNAASSFQTVATSFNSNASEEQPAFNNPFAKGPSASGQLSFDFGAGSTPAAQPGSTSFIFGGGSTGGNNPAPASTPFSFGAGATPTQSTAPMLSFGGDSQNTAQPTSNLFGGGSGAGSSGGLFSFNNGSQQANGTSSIFGANKPAAPGGNIFNLAPPAGGTSTGTSTPFAFGGASSLATTPAAGTPEPETKAETKPEATSNGAEEKPAEGDDDAEAPQKQISLTEGGPGEEDEDIIHEVRAKALKFVPGGDESDGESGKGGKGGKKDPWKTQGVGPFRILKHKTTGAVRMLLRQQPSGKVAMNKALLPDFTYKVEPAGGKYVKLTTAKEDGSGLETWMLQVKTKEAAQALAEALEANKGDKKKK